mgnify:CR=1 FL=1
MELLVSDSKPYVYIALILTILYSTSFILGTIYSDVSGDKTAYSMAFLQYASKLPNEEIVLDMLVNMRLTFDIYVYTSFLIALIKGFISFLISLIPALYAVPLFMKGNMLAHTLTVNGALQVYSSLPFIALEILSAALVSASITVKVIEFLKGWKGVGVLNFLIYGFVGFIAAFSIEEIFISFIPLI